YAPVVADLGELNALNRLAAVRMDTLFGGDDDVAAASWNLLEHPAQHTLQFRETSTSQFLPEGRLEGLCDSGDYRWIVLQERFIQSRHHQFRLAAKVLAGNYRLHVLRSISIFDPFQRHFRSRCRTRCGGSEQDR